MMGLFVPRVLEMLKKKHVKKNDFFANF